jgi:CO dehydrogenase nickel-insertion accessory protein CooC1
VYNRATTPLDPALTEAAEEHGLQIAGVIPDDPGIGACDLAGKGLFEMEDDSAALAAVKDMLATVTPRAEAQAG